MPPARRHTYNKGAWQLQQERHRLDEEITPPRIEPNSSIAAAVTSIISKLGLQQTLDNNELSSDWKTLVGPQIAAQTRPGTITRKVLAVYVRNSVWLQELSRMPPKTLLEKVKARLGPDKVTTIKFLLDSEPRR